jgi:hypothetical protein
MKTNLEYIKPYILYKGGEELGILAEDLRNDLMSVEDFEKLLDILDNGSDEYEYLDEAFLGLEGIRGNNNFIEYIVVEPLLKYLEDNNIKLSSIYE